ncbi:MAG: folylpolyglutamate synthase/dihydrofolate synthase family protein [Coleofasciculaceae cyanobacterium]
MNIDSLLKPYQRFGVHLGLDRIKKLLKDLDNPHHAVPIIHVAGTNGKGSVCAYLSSVLTEAGYKVGRYTSPHLINWTERICLNGKPIASEELKNLLLQIQAVIDHETEESPTQFEVITAAAWLYFAQQQVDIAVVEVGLGGRLDATNVCKEPLVSIITSLSREHWQNLGPTLSDIAREKAGILKQNAPAVIGPLPPEATVVVESKIKQVNCPTTWVEPAKEINNQDVSSPIWARYQSPDKCNPKFLEYPVPLLGQIQLTNSALAIATLQILQQQGWQITEKAIISGMAKTRWLGRLQWTSWHNHKLLIDGAHNPAAAIALRQYIDTLNRPINWVMGMLSTKDHAEVFQALLKPADQLYLLPVPNHSSADPETLAAIAKHVCPDLANCQTYLDLPTALEAANSNSAEVSDNLVVLCGSLYLVGYFLNLEYSDSI